MDILIPESILRKNPEIASELDRQAQTKENLAIAKRTLSKARQERERLVEISRTAQSRALDLFKNFVQNMEMEVVKIEVCDLRDNTFYALIYFASDDQVFTMDARPSDAIAIALRFDAPIYVDSDVIEKARVTEPKAEVLDKSSAGKKWAEYLNDLSPEDFGKYKM